VLEKIFTRVSLVRYGGLVEILICKRLRLPLIVMNDLFELSCGDLSSGAIRRRKFSLQKRIALEQ
jgi:hypothetical protein